MNSIKKTRTFLNLACLGLLGLSVAACGGGSDEEGQFDIRWTFASGGPCVTDEVIRVTYSPDVGSDIFPCLNADGMQQGLTGNLPLGVYQITVEAGTGDGFGTPFTPNPAITPAVTSGMLTFDGDVQVVNAVLNDAGGGPTEFNVSFAVDFGLDDDGASPNCTQTDAGGLGVSQQHITLLDMTAGACVDVTITADAMTASTCDPTGTNMVCMETTVVQTLAAVPAGDYVLEIRGFKSGSVDNACWVGAFAFDTADSPTLADITLGELTAPFDAASTEPACQLKRSRTTVASAGQ